VPDQSSFLSRRPALTINLSGFFGSGKTLQAHSFPKCYTISCDPEGLEALRQPRNAKYLRNLVWYEELHNENEADLKKLFRETAKSEDRESIYGCLAHVRELAAKGEVETLIIDGFTYFVDMKWAAINEFEEVRSGNSGNRDSQAMYRNLGLYLQRFVASDLMTMASRQRLNIILTTHLKRESEEQVQGGTAKNRARKVALNSDIAPMVEGGFRNKLEGLVGASLYFDKRIKDGKVAYEAICDIAPGLGTIVNAKNRFGLPARLPLTDASLYEAIMNSLAIKGSVTAAVKPTGAASTPTAPPQGTAIQPAKPTTTVAQPTTTTK
jgi:hypothetical protein